MNRREALIGAAAITTVAALPVGVALASTGQSIVVRGTAHPVTSIFMDLVGSHRDLLTRSYEALEAEKHGLLELSNRRGSFREPMPKATMAVNGTLTVAENERLEAVVHVMNVHHGVNFLGGKDHTDYGFEGVDQVHGNAHTLPCGCILHSVHDHHHRGTEKAIPIPHRVHRSCDGHAHLAKDVHKHWEAAHADAV